MSNQTFEFLLEKNTEKELLVVIDNVLESDILNINHILNIKNVLSLKTTEKKTYATLELFARGNYSLYKENKSNYNSLSEKMIWKLKKLTVIAIASESKSLNYTNLMQLLDLKDEFELDSLLFELNILGWVTGTIDHSKKLFNVCEVKPRDYIEDWSKVEKRIESWIERVEKMEELITKESDTMNKSADEYENYLNLKAQEARERKAAAAKGEGVDMELQEKI